MRLEVRLGRRNHFQGHQLESLLLESRNNISNESSLDTVRLHHNVCLFSRHFLLVCLCDESKSIFVRTNESRLCSISKIGEYTLSSDRRFLFCFPLKSWKQILRQPQGKRKKIMALQAAFDKCKKEGRTAFIPYITAGYPNKNSTVELLLAMVRV